MDICWIIDTIGCYLCCSSSENLRGGCRVRKTMLYKLTIDDSHVLKKEPKIGNIAKCTLMFRRQVWSFFRLI